MTTDKPSLPEYLSSWLPRIERDMRAAVNAGEQPTALNAMLRYHLGFANADGSPSRVAAGKRIRPILVLLSCEACGGDPDVALPAAVAVELLHNFSLIHDDIEDGDALRRGRQTLWKLHGLAQGINAGDAMFAQAHQALERLTVPAERTLAALRAFDAMCVHLTIGQHLDISFETREDVSAAEYMRMIAGKTAALTAVCCEIGGLVAGASPAAVARLGEFGRSLGLAFQLQDDVLGIWGDSAQTGKPQNDLGRRKKTLPILFAADQDPALRADYFGPNPIDERAVKARIEQLGGRAHTEQLSTGLLKSGQAALAHDELRAPGTALLSALASSLIGRVS